MQSQYAKDGLAAVSVSLDDTAEKDTRENVLKFLKAKKATFTNLILDEKPEVWQEKLNIDGPPCVFVFNREGKVIKQYKEGVDYGEVEKLVVEELKKG
jgi:hypothetical protein